MYVVYSKPNCQFCDKAKALLKQKGYELQEVDLTKDPETLQKLKEMGCRSVPQIFLTDLDEPDLHIGGYDNLVDHLHFESLT